MYHPTTDLLLGLELPLRGNLVQLDAEGEAELLELLVGVGLAQRREQLVAHQRDGRHAWCVLPGSVCCLPACLCRVVGREG